MKKNTLLSFLSIMFFSLLFVGQNIAQDKASIQKNIGKFITVSENGNQRDLQGASTALITGTDKGSNIHFEHPYNPGNTMHVFAGTFNGTLDGSNANFYCIDISHGLVYNQDYTDEGPTQAEITYVLNNYYPHASYPYAGSASTEKLEAAAVQAVMWHYADGMDLTTIQEAEVKSRAIAIAADADANASSVTYPDYFTISPASTTLPNGTVGNFTISAFDTNGNPFEGMDITISATSGTLSTTQVTTDVNGVASFTLAQGGVNSATITASAQAVIPQGTKYFHVANPNGKQKLVLGTPTIATSNAQSDVTWEAAPIITPPPAPNCSGGTSFLWENNIVVNGTNVSTDVRFITGNVTSFVIPGPYPAEFNSAVDITISEAVAWDGYATRASTGEQPDERFRVLFKKAGVVVGTSPFTGASGNDGIATGVISDFWAGSLGSTISLPNGTDEIVLQHYSDANGGSNPNSVYPSSVCLAYSPSETYTLGDYIWHDSNVNGIQDATEDVFKNVIVQLYDNAGNILATTTTDNNGYYFFTDLDNGTYKVKVADANFNAGGVFDNTSDNEKWYITYKDKGSDDAVDSDGDSNNEAIAVINNADNLTIDFGFFHTCVSLIKSGPQSVTAGDIINYTFTIHNCGDIILHGGASVYDAMLNPNGDHKIAWKRVQPGETWEFTKSYVTTDAQCGSALVNDAYVIGHPKMPDGSYKPNVRYDDSHSVDVLCVEKAFLGDRVWYDANENGIQDFGENGVSGVMVNLYSCADVFIESTTTDVNGYYMFNNLDAGSYYVQFVLPNGYVFTTQNTGSDSAIDSDADETTGKTVCTDLVAGEVDLTWDAGIYAEHANDFDLSIVKTASNTNPDDGAIITYTITVTNNGSVDGTEITVSDVLPAGLIYQSSSPAGYDTTTGIWTIGDINAGDSKSLDIIVKVDYLSLGTTPVFDLGIAAPFNLFVLKDVVQPSSDTEGKVAVGRDAHFTGYSVGDKLAPSGGTEDVLIVGRKLTYVSGQVYGGNVVYGQFFESTQQNLCSDGSIRQENPVPVDFAQAEVDLNALSSQLAAKQTTGTTTFQWGGLTLTGSDPLLNVFEVSGADLSSANNMQIDVPNGSVVLVNIDGTDITWTGGLTVNGTAIGNVLYNFHQAQDIYIQGIDIRGSVLAPKAKVNFVTGVINGQMICNYFEGQGQMNNSLFHGNIPGNPEITNCAEINGYDQVDIDITNNKSCVDILVNVEFNPNNGDDEDTGSKWVEFGGTGLSEMIWSMYQTKDGLLVGTVGGNIYLNNGTEFKLLNEGMSVMYIWSLYEYDGHIFAGTEQGLFRYDGKVWAKVEIKGDVRSITSIDKVLYAAVWGAGVFSSNDNGVTWVAMNEGLVMSGYAVQTLTVANGNLFVGTFSLGVLRYDADNSIWVELPVGYPFIWALATDADNNIFAATSGGGVYMSSNNGDNWNQMNSGLSNMHIYSVSVYGNDVYVSTWSGGVYKFVASSLAKAGKGDSSIQSVPVGSWSSLGMGGIEVSSIMVDEATQTLYAGTSSGTIYKKVDGVTDVTPSDVVPSKFGLEQNYPNPFNPSTKIEFSIAEAGMYSVKVFNVLGQEVATVANQDFSAGKFTFNFDASHLTSGIYFYKLVGENVNLTKKMMLLK